MAKDHRIVVPSSTPYRLRFEELRDDGFDNFVSQWDYIRRNLVIFLGAGASVGAANIHGQPLPTAYFLRNELWRRFMLAPDERAGFDFSNLGLMSLEHAAAIVEAHASRAAIMDVLAELFRTERSLWQHACLPFLQPRDLFTTNYDTLIEQGWYQLQQASRLKEVFHPVGRNGYTPLYKPHGSVDNRNKLVAEGGVVITQFDYYEIINNRKLMLEHYFEGLEDKYVLFVGYSFMDFDISSIVFDFARRANRRNWYAVFPRNDAQIKDMYLRRFNIRVIPATFFEFMYFLDEAVGFLPSDARFGSLSDVQKAGLQGF